MVIQASSLYEQIDATRRQWGRYLDRMGWGPQETPFQSVLTRPCLTLRCYDQDAPAGEPVVLLVPAPIKSASIWDLAPWASVVRRCKASGFRVYLIQWEPPGASERGLDLTDYADRLILDCLDVIRTHTGQTSVFMAGHSLGGTCAALFSALHPERIKGLILLGTPLHFGKDIGVFGPVVAAAPPVRTLTAQWGNIPGSLLDGICLSASPTTFGWSRRLDWLASLNDPQALRTHFLVERWTLDEMPLAQCLFEELVEYLYREDRFMRGILEIGGKQVTPGQVIAPLLSVVDRQCTVVPPEAILPFHRAATSPHKKVLWYGGDIGISLQHVGILVGKDAHERLWPKIIRWMRAHIAG